MKYFNYITHGWSHRVTNSQPIPTTMLWCRSFGGTSHYGRCCHLKVTAPQKPVVMSSNHSVWRMLVPGGGFIVLHFENMTQASLFLLFWLSNLLIKGEGSVFDQCMLCHLNASHRLCVRVCSYIFTTDSQQVSGWKMVQLMSRLDVTQLSWFLDFSSMLICTCSGWFRHSI